MHRYVPQAALLPHCSAAVIHGGAGTMLGALAAGLPLLCLPQGADQYGNADRVVAAGAGLALVRDELAPQAVRAATRAVLDEPGYPAGCPTHRRRDRRHADTGRGADCDHPASRPARSAVVVELQGDVEVRAAQQLLDRLQVVALLAADPELVALDLRLDALRALVADQLGDLLRDVGLDALLDARGDLVDLAGGLRLVGVERLQRDLRLISFSLKTSSAAFDPLLGVGLRG